MNKVLRMLLFSDIFLLSGFGLVAPIWSVYIKDNLIGGTLITAGIAGAIFLITKSLIQIPFSKYADSIEESQDIFWLLSGAAIICVVPFLYIVSRSIWVIFLAQFLYGVGAGFANPIWLKIWEHHLDKNHETFEWSLYSSMVALFSALAGIVGAWISFVFGFSVTFIFVGIFSVFSFFFLFYLRNLVIFEKKQVSGIMLEFPELRQTFNYDCGASVLESVLVYYGQEVREDQIMQLAKTNKNDGTFIENIIRTIRNFRLKTIHREMTISDIKKFLRNHIPVILVLQAWTDKEKIDWKQDWDDGHYVVAIGYDKEKIYFEDPSSFERTYLTFDELRTRWHDVDVNEKKYYNYGIAVYGKTPSFSNHTFIHMN